MNNLKRNLVENYKEQLNENLVSSALRWLIRPAGAVPKIVDPVFDLASKGLRWLGGGNKAQRAVRAAKYGARAAGRAAAVGVPAYLVGRSMLGSGSIGSEQGIDGRSLDDMSPDDRRMSSREARKERKRREALTRGLELSAAAEAGSPEELIAAKVGTSNRARAIAANVQKEKIKRLKAAGYGKGDEEYDAAVGALSTVRPITGPLVTRQRPGPEGMIDRTAGYVNPNSPEARVIADIKSGALDPSVLRTSDPSHQRAIRAVEAAGKKVPLEITRQEIERRGEEAVGKERARQKAEDAETQKRIEAARLAAHREINARLFANYDAGQRRKEREEAYPKTK